jgi:hypothetical protein
MSKRTALADHTSDLAIMADAAPSVMVTDAPAATPALLQAWQKWRCLPWSL